MASEKKQSESVPMNKLNEVANENYKKLSDEFAKSMQAARYRQYQIYSKNIWNQLRSLTGVQFSQKEYFSNSHSYYQEPITATANTENMINHSNEYTRNLINWMNIQNKLMAKTTELLKEYVKEL